MTINSLALAFNMPTLLILLALALLIFGNRLPSIGKNLGKSIVGFKKGLKEGDKSDDDDDEEDDDDDDDDDDDIEEPVAKKKTKQLEGQSAKKVKTERQPVASAEED